MMPMEPLVATGGGCRGSEPVQTTLPAAGAHETLRGCAAFRGLLPILGDTMVPDPGGESLSSTVAVGAPACIRGKGGKGDFVGRCEIDPYVSSSCTSSSRS